ncbi:MAG: SDR family NAD(P)-dependent oxidoreductase [Actinomycetota bacterium]|nr:SDR family NAD(P)-dependent oxidoreductase [Actinomycetota bacterium]
MKITDSVVFVTGGASGLGAAVVRRCVASGAKGVVIFDVSADKASALADELGGTVLATSGDITDSAQITAAIDAAKATFGRIDVLVGCAGIPWAERTVSRDGAAATLMPFAKLIGVNLVGMFDAASQCAAAMSVNEPREDGERGVIIMTASIAAFDGQVGQVAYSASKGGIVGMTLPMARDLGPVGIRVVTVAPGLVDTPIYDFAPPELKEGLAKQPVFPRRLGTPAEFAHLVEHIVENPYLNGEVIRIDGALRMPPK